MATQFTPPPTYAEPVVVDEVTKKAAFNPIWLKWFLDVAYFISQSGGGGGGAGAHNSLSGLQGGATGEYYHFTAAEHTSLGSAISVQTSGTVFSGPISGGSAAPSFKVRRSITWKNADTSRTSTTTLANDPDLTFTIGANETWVGRCFMDVGAALGTTGVKFTITAPTGSSGNIHAYLETDATSGKENQIGSTNTLGTAIDFTAAGMGAGTTSGFLEMLFRVVNGANAGSITVQWAQSTSSGTALTVGAGSQMSADRVA